MRRRMTGLATLLAAAGLAACEGGGDVDAGPPPLVTRDSAGITIVENHRALDVLPALDPGPPIFDLGAVDGPPETLLSGVAAVALLADGRVAIADRGYRIRTYEADGRFFGSFGRDGDGPGEFRGIRGMWPREDGQLAVLDGRAWRVTLIDGPAYTAVHPVRPAGANPPRSSGMLADGRIVIAERIFDIPPTGFEPLETVIRVAALDTVPPDTVARIEGANFGLLGDAERGMVGAPVFEPAAWTEAAGDRIVTTDCRTPEVRELAPDGTLRRIVRWPAGDRTVTDAHVAAYRDWRLGRAEEGEARRQAAEFFASLPVSAELPACGWIHAADEGRVLVQEFAVDPGAPQRWLLFRDGELVATLALPAGARLMAVRGDRLATVERDDVDVEHVRVYRLPAVETESE